MVLTMPALLPADWSAAHAKKTRQKIKVEKSRRPSVAARASSSPTSLAAVLPASPAPVAPAVPMVFTWPLILTLSTDRPSYNPGDLMTIAAVADAACDLTLVSIDRDGFAVVLFPNGYEPDNLMSAGVPKTIPRVDAAYQLRAKLPGTETLLGICAPPGTRPRGIVADYERYRFTLIGDWAEFTGTVAQREAEIVRAAKDAQRKRRRREAPLAPLLPPSDPPSQGRTLLLVQVNEAP